MFPSLHFQLFSITWGATPSRERQKTRKAVKVRARLGITGLERSCWGRGKNALAMDGHGGRPGHGVEGCPRGRTQKPGTTHFIMLQAVDHEFRKDDHARPSHPGTAVHHDGGVPVLGAFQHAVGMATDRLDLLQVGCKTKCKSCH